MLFNLHRDVRYSVSPRFELEILVSKLCWLDRWVSPLELRNAISQARDVLGRGGGVGRPLAFRESPAEIPGKTDRGKNPGPGESPSPGPESSTGISEPLVSAPVSSADGGFFDKLLISLEKGKTLGPPFSPPGPNEGAVSEGIPGETGGGEYNSQVQTVLKVFEGTIVEGGFRTE